MGASRYIPNIITLMRPLLTLIFVYCILQGHYISAISMFATIGLTDIFDGVAARALAACTRLGALMDVSADLLYVMASLVVLNIKGLAPAWFTAVTALKFVEFAGTSSILNRRVGNKSTWIFEGLGRWFSALALISPVFFALRRCIRGLSVRCLFPARILLRPSRFVVRRKVVRWYGHEIVLTLYNRWLRFDRASAKKYGPYALVAEIRLVRSRWSERHHVTLPRCSTRL
jgi:CDP-diacylglycerol--glycerol-3-phosphate 3-phosphatidyltransferase